MKSSLKIFYIYASILIITLPHCKKQNLRTKFETIANQSQKRFDIEPRWKDKTCKEQVGDIIDEGMSLNDAITIGINNNLSLQTTFEEIGIRNSDLIQAGFYTNPHIETLFKIPKNDKKILQKNIEVSASFMLSDLWQVPLRKKIAEQELEVKTHEIVNEILDLRYNIQKRYITCLYSQARVDLTKEITETINTLKKRIYYRYQFGYANDLDKYFVDSKIGEWEVRSIEAEKILLQSYVQLREILGGTISMKAIHLVDPLKTTTAIPSLEQLEYIALTSHPGILIEQAKIARANKLISYEKSQIIDNVHLGISYEREFEKRVSGVGPLLSFDIPLFDTNYGNIERAKFLHKQAEKALAAQQQAIAKNVTSSYINYVSYIKQIHHYEKTVIPPVINAIEFGKEFFDRMQMSMIIFLETQIDLYKHKLELLELIYKTAIEYATLEFVTGTQLENTEINSQNQSK